MRYYEDSKVMHLTLVEGARRSAFPSNLKVHIILIVVNLSLIVSCLSFCTR
jgi:hypothetical protein